MRKSVVIFSPEAMKRQLAGVILSRLMTRGLLELEAAQLEYVVAMIAKFYGK